MAIRLTKENDHVQYGTTNFVADAAADITSLPTKVTPGSECFCIETSTTYILNNQREWKVKSKGGGGPSPSYQEKTVTPDFSDGDVSVTADSKYDALSEVTIQKDSNLIAENIKKDVTVHGVTGSYEGVPIVDTRFANWISGVSDSLSGDDVLSIGDNVFKSNVLIKNVSFPNATSVGTSAFQNASAIKDVYLPKVEGISSYGFAACTVEKINLDSIETLGNLIFQNCTNLTEISCPNLKTIGNSCFSGCSKLSELNFPQITSVGSSCFSRCTSIESISFPKLVTLSSSCFSYCTNLRSVDIKTKYIDNQMFDSDGNLVVLILRNDTKTDIAHVNCFRNTPFVDEVTTATLYVPQAFISDYQNDSKWSQILAHEGTTIQKIEGSPYENP